MKPISTPPTKTEVTTSIDELCRILARIAVRIQAEQQPATSAGSSN